MLENLHGICLRIVRHSDSASIATLWTRERGRVAVSVPASASPAARRVRALMMPLGMVEGVADFRAGREVVHLRDVRPSGAPAVEATPLQGVVSLFVADFLYAVLGQSAPDANLTDFIFMSVETLRRARGTELANFHIVFMCRLGRFLGIAPDTGSYTRGSTFDMREGIFRRTPPEHRDVLTGVGARLAYMVLTTDYGSMHHLRMPRLVRNTILDHILQYYSLHHTKVTGLTSLTVVRDVLG